VVLTGVLCALPEELGGLARAAGERRSLLGLELLEMELGGQGLLACVSGVGKVNAARAATLLLAQGIERLLIVGTCGGLRAHLGPGTLVHCARAIQTDLAVRAGRECTADGAILAAWQAEVGGRAGSFLTADRPVLSLWRRLRLARAFAGDCVADMETAAAAAVARAGGIPWGALRAVTDRAGHLGLASFRHHYPVQAGRAADSVAGLLQRLAGTPGEAPRPTLSGPSALP
jgi:adenosylhomocysteine nucleosidase